MIGFRDRVLVIVSISICTVIDSFAPVSYFGSQFLRVLKDDPVILL
jgi:hypothetical protein